MHHKRKRPKNSRAGCLLCKPHKGNGQKRRLALHPIKTGGGRMRALSASADELAESQKQTEVGTFGAA